MPTKRHPPLNQKKYPNDIPMASLSCFFLRLLLFTVRCRKDDQSSSSRLCLIGEEQSYILGCSIGFNLHERPKVYLRTSFNVPLGSIFFNLLFLMYLHLYISLFLVIHDNFEIRKLYKFPTTKGEILISSLNEIQYGILDKILFFC